MNRIRNTNFLLCMDETSIKQGSYLFVPKGRRRLCDRKPNKKHRLPKAAYLGTKSCYMTDKLI